MTRASSAPDLVRRLRGQNGEGILVVTIIVLAVVVGLKNSAFWSLPTALNIASATVENLVFAMAVLLVIISGGIDVSFMAVGIFAGYSVVILQNSGGFAQSSALVAFVIATLIGLALGLLNAVPIAFLGLPTLIVTLGTQGIIRGLMLAYVGSKVIPDYPDGLTRLSTDYLVTVHRAGADTRLNVLVIPAAVIVVLMALLLRHTVFGRSVYAIGGDSESARRIGFPVVRTQVLVYLLTGALAAVGGLMHVTTVRLANPYELVGGELDVIAAVVLGGASIFGGRGSVSGTVLGVVLISLIKNSLILLGVPGTWQRAAVGMLLLIGVSVQALSARERRRHGELGEVYA
jgi:simple sugar transport system permease protein